VVAAICLVVELLALFTLPARAAAPPPGDPQNELLAPYADWVRGLTNPATGQGCCSLSDCRVADYRIAKDGSGYEAFLDSKTWRGAPNTWVPVPDYVVTHHANPTGFAVACWAVWHKTTDGFFCFTPASGT